MDIRWTIGAGNRVFHENFISRSMMEYNMERKPISMARVASVKPFMARVVAPLRFLLMSKVFEH